MEVELIKKGANFTKSISTIEGFFSNKDNVTVERIRPDRIELRVPKGTTGERINDWMADLSSIIEKEHAVV